MADTLTQFQTNNGGAGAFQFMDGSGFNASGQVVNTPQPDAKIPTPAVFSSTNAANKVQGINNTIGQYNGLIQQNKQQAMIEPPNQFLTDLQKKSAQVTSYTDNPNGTTTNHLSDGTNSTVQYQQNADGTLQPTEIDPNKQISQLMQQQIQEIQQAQTQYYQEVAQLRNGTYPLTADQQAMIQSIQDSVQRQIQKQEQLNNAYLANVNMAGIRSGRSRYTTETQDNEIFTAQTDALQKVRTIENEGLALINQTKQAFNDKQWKMLNDSFNQFQENRKTVADAYYKLLQANNDAEKAANDRLKAILDEQRAQRKEQLDQATAQQKQLIDAQKFAVDNGITQPVYRIGNQLYDTRTQQPITSLEQAQALGVKDDMSNVQEIQPKKQYSSGVIGEYERYLEDVKAGKSKWMSFNDYSTMDANRKAVRTTVNNSYNIGGFNDEMSKKQLGEVQAIITANPREWGKAADAIDKKFGAGTATKYDALLKQTYLLPNNAQNAAAELTKAMGTNDITKAASKLTYDQWLSAQQKFIQENGYVNPDDAAKIFENTIPQPSKTGSKNQAP